MTCWKTRKNSFSDFIHIFWNHGNFMVTDGCAIMRNGCPFLLWFYFFYDFIIYEWSFGFVNAKFDICGNIVTQISVACEWMKGNWGRRVFSWWWKRNKNAFSHEVIVSNPLKFFTRDDSMSVISFINTS